MFHDVGQVFFQDPLYLGDGCRVRDEVVAHRNDLF
jgi:hypothetical protein